MAARKRRVALSDDWKANIQATQIMNRLYGHVLGDVELSQTQINAAKIILAKILPDLAHTDLNATVETGPNLAAILSKLGSNS
jgi:hypothetical protein